MWSLGAFLELDDRAKLETFLRDSQEISLDLPPHCDRVSSAETSMFDYLVDTQGLCAGGYRCTRVGLRR